MSTSPSTVAEVLTALLLPFEDRTLSTLRNRAGVVDQWRFVDAPPATVTAALTALPEAAASARPNGQPPAEWLVRVAEEVGGRLCGAVLASRSALRVDALCIPGAAAADVVQLLQHDWPGQAEIAVAEGWTGWDATSSSWTGLAAELLGHRARFPVCSLWWD